MWDKIARSLICVIVVDESLSPKDVEEGVYIVEGVPMVKGRISVGAIN